MINFNKVPNLITALQGPLQFIEQSLIDNERAIEAWLQDQFQLTRAPLYCSVDLRNAGFKISPVDTNLFPAGFNNLNPEFFPLCVKAMQITLNQSYPGAQKLLIIPEDHTRNIYYYENLSIIKDILVNSGFEVEIGSLLHSLKTSKILHLPSGQQITLNPIQRQGQRVAVKGFIPDIIISNNDFSGGVPEVLRELRQPIVPSLNLGWHVRRKSQHFEQYAKVADELSQQLGIDPWLISPLFLTCEGINFLEKQGEETLVARADRLLKRIKEKYEEYAIEKKPFLVIKADSGTYGRAVMMIHDPEELLKLNRKERAKMDSIKGGQKVTRVIIQEGVHTIEIQDRGAAEPVIYMIGEHLVGGFYRIHPDKGIDENLNAPGMHFEQLKFGTSVNRFYPYTVIARLALLAAAREGMES